MSQSLLEQLETEYRRRTPRSLVLHDEARQWLPGGDTRTNTFYPPYPTFMRSGQGCRITDVDGNVYLDFLNNYTSLVHGHAHPRINEAVQQQLTRGNAFASPIEAQSQLAEMLCSRVRSIERVRFCNSGTEATMNAMRLAKAFTGRNKIMKMEGGYHGTHDAAMVSVAPQPSLAGPVSAPYSVPSAEGMFRGVLSDIVVAPFNDIDSTKRLIERHGDELAAIIVEPMMGAGGGIRASQEYLNYLAAAAHQAGALLIFDEIVTFRLAYGGAQEIYGIDPDLTTLGKMIGGGFPVGAFGGRAEIMSLFDPARKRLAQAGTYNGNAITMVAGIAALELLTSGEIARINSLGERLATGLVARSRSHGIPIQVSSFGSLLQVHFLTEPVDSYRSAACGSKALSAIFHIGLLNRGIFTSTRNSMSISTAMTESEVDLAVGVFGEVLSHV